jgi:hypothetical protein
MPAKPVAQIWLGQPCWDNRRGEEDHSPVSSLVFCSHLSGATMPRQQTWRGGPLSSIIMRSVAHIWLGQPCQDNRRGEEDHSPVLSWGLLLTSEWGNHNRAVWMINQSVGVSAPWSHTTLIKNTEPQGSNYTDEWQMSSRWLYTQA